MSAHKQSLKQQPSVFGRPTFRDQDGARDIFRTFEDKRTIAANNPVHNTYDFSANTTQILDKELEEIRKMDLGESDLKPLDQERQLVEQEAAIAIKEADDKMESISNRVPE